MTFCLLFSALTSISSALLELSSEMMLDSIEKNFSLAKMTNLVDR